ncbi:U4/U6 X U5 tri-snRNP complex subunit [Schizosaccharomyces japonicus yFS275]|uniref:U4/U6 X U5 tri-snRNP complex subunit n=1 Tax=Schizosaccharomyces japonicus (strain yFS275 / FY16936) TaxID=402676 RepID=B6K421_SCHJY|nr:U4/U6 X U5 tri-snRNP complex subunit [Schizosaccharomyces japonicus yFS275]EEB08228.1 U4/U6 X U5 tri-snRNP complex subunit [Schizosaccharomyces japonicus yFS275]
MSEQMESGRPRESRVPERETARNGYRSQQNPDRNWHRESGYMRKRDWHDNRTKNDTDEKNRFNDEHRYHRNSPPRRSYERSSGRRRERDWSREGEREHDRNHSSSPRRHRRSNHDTEPPRLNKKNVIPDVHQEPKRNDKPPEIETAAQPINNQPSDNKNEETSLTPSDELEDVSAIMGFTSFGTTAGKKHGDIGAVFKQKKTKYRQYMNREGGFNRPLDRE